MDLLNIILTKLVDLLWIPLGPLPGVLTLVVWSALAGILAGLLFRYTSNQKALGDVADKVRANLLAMRLFKDELAVTLRCQCELMKAAGMRFWYALPAFVVMLIPFVLLLVQLALRYEHRPLRVGEAALVRLDLSPEAWSKFRDAQLVAPAGVTVETPALRDKREHAIYWRIRPQSAGVSQLRWELGQGAIEKRLTVSDDSGRLCIVSDLRPGRNFWDRLLYPGERALPADSPAQGIAIDYPARTTPMFGVDVPWWLTFLIASILIAFLLRPVLKVRF